MKIYVYPYRQQDGYRSILEAVNIDDAKQHLSAFTGTVFCQIERPDGFERIVWCEDFEKLVDQYLRDNKTITT